MISSDGKLNEISQKLDSLHDLLTSIGHNQATASHSGINPSSWLPSKGDAITASSDASQPLAQLVSFQVVDEQQEDETRTESFIEKSVVFAAQYVQHMAQNSPCISLLPELLPAINAIHGVFANHSKGKRSAHTCKSTLTNAISAQVAELHGVHLSSAMAALATMRGASNYCSVTRKSLTFQSQSSPSYNTSGALSSTHSHNL